MMGWLDAVVDQVGRPPDYIGHPVGHEGDHWTIKDLSKECHVCAHTGVSISIFARAFEQTNVVEIVVETRAFF